jgi:hypothetical protein
MLNFDQQFEKDRRTDMVFDQQQFVQEETKNVVGMVVKRERKREREKEHMMRRTRGVSVLFIEIQ